MDIINNYINKFEKPTQFLQKSSKNELKTVFFSKEILMFGYDTEEYVIS